MMLRVTTGVVLAIAGLALSGCQVTKTQDAKAPSVSVKASGGQLPKFDVQGPEVKVGTKTKTIEVPTVDVKTPGEKK